MAREWTTKTFKSGNSIAIRLPKATGIREGDEFIVVDHEDGTFDIRPAGSDAATLDALFGSFSPDFMADGRGDIEQSDRSWDREPAVEPGAA